MNILAIGNSFSQDATRFLHDCAKQAGSYLRVVNLYIGGCPLSLHYKNMLSGNADYALEYNGENTEFKVSLEQALLATDWDVITVQQVSQLSPHYESYQPYLNELAFYIRKCQPKAKLYIHETWAYEKDSPRLLDIAKYKTYTEMYNDIHASYSKAAEAVNADGIIPSGTLFKLLADTGVKIHRDTFHATYDYGRFALALLWLKCLTKTDISSITPEFNYDGTVMNTIREKINDICK